MILDLGVHVDVVMQIEERARVDAAARLADAHELAKRALGIVDPRQRLPADHEIESARRQVEIIDVANDATRIDALRRVARAYIDAARRLKGQDVPMIVPAERKRFFDKLFGRRAA